MVIKFLFSFFFYYFTSWLSGFATKIFPGTKFWIFALDTLRNDSGCNYWFENEIGMRLTLAMMEKRGLGGRRFGPLSTFPVRTMRVEYVELPLGGRLDIQPLLSSHFLYPEAIERELLGLVSPFWPLAMRHRCKAANQEIPSFNFHSYIYSQTLNFKQNLNFTLSSILKFYILRKYIHVFFGPATFQNILLNQRKFFIVKISRPLCWSLF